MDNARRKKAQQCKAITLGAKNGGLRAKRITLGAKKRRIITLGAKKCVSIPLLSLLVKTNARIRQGSMVPLAGAAPALPRYQRGVLLLPLQRIEGSVGVDPHLHRAAALSLGTDAGADGVRCVRALL